MKKILSILGSIGLIATTATTVVACGETKPELGKLSQKELQEKIEFFIKTETELQEKLDETPEGSAEYLKIEDEIAKNYFEMHFFIAGLFLDTKYSINLGSSEEVKIVEEKDEWIYHLLLEKSALSFKQKVERWKEQSSEWRQKYAEYISRFEEYAKKLEKKAGIEDLSKLNLNQLNEKNSSLYQVILDLIEENEETDYPYPWENPDLKDQWLKAYFNLYSFFARIFWETEFVVDIASARPEIKEIKDEEEYQKLLQKLVDRLGDRDQLQGNEHCIYIFNLYIWELQLSKNFS